MTVNRFQRGEDIKFYVGQDSVEVFVAATEIKVVLYPDGIDLSREANASKIVVLDPMAEDDTIVFTASHETTAAMAAGDYNLELVYTVDGQRSICKQERAFTLEDSATNHISTNNDNQQ